MRLGSFGQAKMCPKFCKMNDISGEKRCSRNKVPKSGESFFQKGLIVFIVIAFLLFTFGCAEDKSNDFVESFARYQFLCPSGVSGCYADCGVSYDSDGSGVIEPAEEPKYNSCTGSCDGKCSTAFLYAEL